jgi:hypothetical protein
MQLKSLSYGNYPLNLLGASAPGTLVTALKQLARTFSRTRREPDQSRIQRPRA